MGDGSNTIRPSRGSGICGAGDGQGHRSLGAREPAETRGGGNSGDGGESEEVKASSTDPEHVSCLLREGDRAILPATIRRWVIRRRAFQIAFRGTEVQRPTFHFLRQAFELSFAVNVGRSFEIETAKSAKSVFNVNFDSGVVYWRALGIGDSERHRTRSGFAVHHRDLVRVRLVLRKGNSAENERKKQTRESRASGHSFLASHYKPEGRSQKERPGRHSNQSGRFDSNFS